MLSRHSRSGIVAHRTVVARGRPSDAALFCIAPPTSRRQGVTGLLRQWQRFGPERGGGQLPPGRSLATAVDDLKLETLPYSGLASPTLPPFRPPRSYDLRAFDPTLPLTIPEPVPPGPPTRTNVYGVPGEVEDMLSVFEACLRVGKVDRAALVLRRLSNVGTLSVQDQSRLIDQYLQASLKQICSSHDKKRAEDLHRWYELQIRSQGLPHTVVAIACMLKASLLSERGPRLHRLVKRYMSMAPEEAGLRVLSMAEILSDTDLAVITFICPTYNFSSQPDVQDSVASSQEELEASAHESMNGGADSTQASPELLPTPQRGLGLSTLNMSLGALSDLEKTDISQLPDSSLREIQGVLERDSITSAITKWRAEKTDKKRNGINAQGARYGKWTRQMGSWLEAMEARLREEQSQIDKSEAKASKTEEDLKRCLYGPLLRQAEPSRLAAVTILTTINLLAMLGIEKGVPVGRLITKIANSVQEDTEMQEEEKANKGRKKRKVEFKRQTIGPGPDQQETVSSLTVERDTAEDSGSSEHFVKVPERAEADHAAGKSPRKPWSLLVKAHVGASLLKILLDTAKVKVTRTNEADGTLVSQLQPAFSHLQQPRRGRKMGLLFLHTELSQKFIKEPIGDFLAKHLPMIVEPRLWESFNEGGFLTCKTNLVRVKPGNTEQLLYSKAALDCGDMDQVLKGLDVLGKTAWRVNEDVFDVMMLAWNSGEEIANFPPLDPEMEIPAEPDTSTDPLVRLQWIRAVKAVQNKKVGLHSQRCFMNLQLEIARAFRKHTIYFPHNVDYRGRAYPIPTYLNHMGADHTRALLKFAKGKELGERGLRWLKIHLANVYGLDKSSFDEREAFAKDNVANIVASATNPLGGDRWWLKAEEPWQCLAACFELKAALDLEDPTKHVSQLPIHQDGTCNGLQHYAALGGDTWGAKQVNLEPGDRPADVYSAVADLVKDAISKDAAAEDPLGKILEGKVTRKVVKQTVMTNVYGVTFAGAKLQVLKQLDALYPNLGKANGLFGNHVLAIYISRHIFHALATMFKGAHDIQYWLGAVGGRVCRALTPLQLNRIAQSHAASLEGKAKSEAGESRERRKTKKPNKTSSKTETTSSSKYMRIMSAQFRSSIVWTTPLRMPVVQPYRKPSAREVRTCLQTLIYSVQEQTDPVNCRKQLQAFPPNFIHSLDASHMMLSALRCHERQLDFAAVHDSFWTHAGDVDSMNQILREAFIQIHEENVIGRLAAEFKARHKGSVYLAHIDADSRVAQKIKDFRKTRVPKLTPAEELLQEHERQKLIMQGKLDEAKLIETPASIYEDMKACEPDVSIEEDTKAIGIGEIHEEEDELAIAQPSEDASVDEEEIETDAPLPPETSGPSQSAQRFLKEVTNSSFETNLTGTKKTPSGKQSKRKPMAIWLPLTIPDVPKKVSGMPRATPLLFYCLPGCELLTHVAAGRL